MKNSAYRGYIFSLLLLLFSPALLATAESDFNLGVDAFKGGDNAAAAGYFESALEQGMESVALHYNLASSYYKLGRYAEAKKYFQIVNQTAEMHELAEYNLGLIATRQQQWRQARRHFNEVIDSGRDEKLSKLSQRQLEALKNKENQITAYVSANLGYDDNITSASSDSVLGNSDTFYDLYASVDYLISGKRREGWVADANLYSIDYSDTNNYDEYQYSLGIKRALLLNDWETSAQLSLSKSVFGDDDYLSTSKIDLYGRKVLSRTDRLYLRYRLEDISSDQPLYDYLDGWRQRFKVEFRQYNRDDSRQVYYELELNNRSELVTSLYAYDYSPLRHTVHAKYIRYLNDRWHLSSDLSYRFSNYPDSATMNRNDEQLRLELGADYRIDSSFKLTAKLQFTNVDSSEDRYSYDKSVIRFGLSKFF
ncbi:MAG: tetratricopeptide repeat protein [Gammaproteobacteria bacterium]|nr:tetratricopeptide repeat protein [Gammaproteobacteria bacterium]MBL6999616.1 tetratricopeptide repeat protein [Gammaproteobacteria bacterium]